MLENLNTVDWQNLHHAYGEASDVPELIRKLASSDEEARRTAIYNLYGNIWHQGTVYEATSYAVPFLIELLKNDEVQGKGEILVLLSHLANGYSYKDVHQSIEADLFGEEAVHTPQYQAEMQVELFWVKQAHDAVAEGMPAYFTLLKHPDPMVRMCVPYTLANLSEHALEILPVVRTHIEAESHPHVRASLLLGMSVFAVDQLQPDVQIFRNVMKTEKEHALVKLAAAMALVRLEKGHTPSPDALQGLLDAIINPQEVEEAYNALPWNDAGVVADASMVLCNAGPAAASIALAPCLEALKKANPYSALSLATAVLSFAFGQNPLPRGTTVRDLTDTQKSVLRALVACDQAWKINVNMAEILEAFALPGWRDQLRTFLEEE